MKRKTSVVVLYNQIGKDPYEELRKVDPATLEFTPEYPVHAATLAEEYQAIVTGLRKEGFRARAVNLREDLGRLQDLLKNHRPDVVFNLVEFFHDEARLEDAIAGLYELYEVPFTGSCGFALGLCRRKGVTKQLLLQNGIASPKAMLLRTPRVKRRHGLRYPLIVKPGRHDASLGVTDKSVVLDHEQLVSQVERIFDEFGEPILVEEFLNGEELHVSILGNDQPEVLPIVQFNFAGLPDGYPPIITHDVKWNPLSEAYHRVHSCCPAQLPSETERRVTKAALGAFTVMGCRDYARVDIRLDSSGRPHVLDVNPNPDLTESVSFMESAEKAGLSFSRTLRRIVEMALERGA